MLDALTKITMVIMVYDVVYLMEVRAMMHVVVHQKEESVEGTVRTLILNNVLLVVWNKRPIIGFAIGHLVRTISLYHP